MLQVLLFCFLVVSGKLRPFNDYIWVIFFVSFTFDFNSGSRSVVSFAFMNYPSVSCDFPQSLFKSSQSCWNYVSVKHLLLNGSSCSAVFVCVRCFLWPLCACWVRREEAPRYHHSFPSLCLHTLLFLSSQLKTLLRSFFPLLSFWDSSWALSLYWCGSFSILTPRWPEKAPPATQITQWYVCYVHQPIRTALTETARCCRPRWVAWCIRLNYQSNFVEGLEPIPATTGREARWSRTQDLLAERQQCLTLPQQCLSET